MKNRIKKILNWYWNLIRIENKGLRRIVLLIIVLWIGLCLFIIYVHNYIFNDGSSFDWEYCIDILIGGVWVLVGFTFIMRLFNGKRWI